MRSVAFAIRTEIIERRHGWKNRIRLIVLIVLLIAGQRPVAAKDNYGSIEGFVLRPGTSQGIAGANIVVRREYDSRKEKGTSENIQTHSDANGHFYYEKLRPGRYWIFSQFPGYYSPSDSSKFVTLAEGEQIRDVAVFLSEGGNIRGRVIQPDGKPLTAFPVELVKARIRDGLRLFMTTGAKVETDASGEYRFNVAPGQYYVRTVSDETHPGVRSYYPGITNPENAVPLNVLSGSDVSADIHISESPVFKISLRIIEGLPDPGDRYVTAFHLIDRNSSVREIGYVPVGCTCPPSGPNLEKIPFVRISKDQYEIRGVRPGSYDLIASMLVGDSRPGELVLIKPGEPVPFSAIYEGRTTVEVKDADVDAGTVEIHHGVDVKGKFTSIGKFHSVTSPWVYMADERGNTAEIAEVSKSWQFLFRNVSAGRHTLSFGFLPDEAYVAEVRQGGKALSEPGLSIGGTSVEPIEVILKPGGMVGGRIDNGDGSMVVLVPVGSRSKYDRGGRAGRVGKSGEFKLLGIPPGEYRIYAINLSSVDESYFNPVFMSRYDSQSLPVTVVPGVPLTVYPKLINP